MQYINAKIDGVNARIDRLQQHMNERFTALDHRFDDMRDLWRS